MKNIDTVLHVRGESRFLDDIPAPEGTLYAAVYSSPIAHGNITRLDTAPAQHAPGIHGVIHRRRHSGGKPNRCCCCRRTVAGRRKGLLHRATPRHRGGRQWRDCPGGANDRSGVRGTPRHFRRPRGLCAGTIDCPAPRLLFRKYP